MACSIGLCRVPGKLRSEKVEMMALCRKQQARIQLLDGHIDDLTKQVSPRNIIHVHVH